MMINLQWGRRVVIILMAGSDNADDLSITHLIVSITHLILSITHLILSITNLIRLMIDYYDEYVRAAHHLTGICC